MEDFPWLAAWVLWEWLSPDGNVRLEQIHDFIQKGFEFLMENNPVSACDEWLFAWESLKSHHKPDDKDIGGLEKRFGTAFSVNNFCQDLEMELHNAGLEDSSYFEKRITYFREFCTLFPEDTANVHNMRRMIAETYGSLGEFEKAEAELHRLIQDFSDNPWGYSGLGDLYLMDMKQQFEKAKALYEKALTVTTDKIDVETIKQRLEDVEALI